ncbi:MAG: ABC transporter ATP-binding protein [Blastocatellia bacterium]|nr:ABC transporter ATP-binding protein [Blastocatellia bacterium]
MVNPSEIIPFTPSVPAQVPEPIALQTRNLTRWFGDFLAVNNLHLEVRRGSFFGFLGPNGAGKSTTIKMLTGLLAPSDGQIELLGYDLMNDPIMVKRLIGVVPEDLNLFDRLTGAEYLTFVGRMHELERHVIAERTAELLRVMELEDKPKALLVEYSHGMRKKISLAAALLHNPQMLFLDEPFEGVDAVAARTIKNLLERMRERGVTIFLTSHILEIVERLCTDIAIINHGRIIASGRLDELRTQAGTNLEEYFVNLVGGARRMTDTLSWIG